MALGASIPGHLIPDHRERWLPLALAAMAGAWVVLSIEPFPVGVFQDDGIYYVLAKSLATGQGYRYLHMPDAPNATHYPPLYPVLLAGFWKLWPASPANVTLFKFLNAAFIALASWGAWRFARRNAGLGPWAALLSVGAFVVCTPIVLVSVMVLSEPMFLASLFPVLMLAERAARTGTPRDAALAGVAGGLLALVRTLGAVAIPATALVLLWRRRWLPALLVSATGFLVMLPWQLWVRAHASEVPGVFLGKYGAYGEWLAQGVPTDRLAFHFDVAMVNLSHVLTLGWDTFGVTAMPAPVRWTATAVILAIVVTGWSQLVRRAPVAAIALAGYVAVVMVWPFSPVRFLWAVWPLLGITFGVAIERALLWRPVGRVPMTARGIGIVAASLLAFGYVKYNYAGFSTRWSTRVQSSVAERARPLAEWVLAGTSEDAIIATDDDIMIHLYTGRRTIPSGTFTPREHVTPQTPAFAAEMLRKILREYDVDYVMASSEYGTYAARGLVQATPPELEIIGALKTGAIFRPVPVGGQP